MSPAEKLSSTYIAVKMELNSLPAADRVSAARDRYARAVELYAVTSLSNREIAEETGLTPKALSRYLARHHRPLLYKRYGLEAPADGYFVRIKPPRGQSRATHEKYRDAIEASGDVAYIEFNISQIARMFGLTGSGLAAQLKVHYPDVIPARERLRKRLGLADGLHRGALPTSKAAYEEAVPVYRDTDLTIQEVAELFGLSRRGFGQYMRHYHHDAISAKALRRREAKKAYTDRKAGTLSGNGQQYGARRQTDDLYARAMELYAGGRKTIGEVISETGVPPSGFRHYLDQWHRDLRRTRKEGKYGEAIASLRERPRAVTEVAGEYGLNADVFREYLRCHAPDLAEGQGMVRLENGKLVKKSAWEKYRPAIEEYRKDGGSLRSMAKKHGLTYNSLLSFMKRTFSIENN